jgi:hypothetical protein
LSKEQSVCLATSRDSQQIFRTPSNHTTLLSDAFVQTLHKSDDLRYSLSWVYGSFIEDIPRRIGTSKALDAAVAALMSSHSSLALNYSAGSFFPTDALTKYTYAIKSLRTTLDVPVLAHGVDTLCAIMLLIICQSFLGTYVGYHLSHGEGAAHILKARQNFVWESDFERKLLLSLRGPVIVEALFNPRIQFTPEEWDRLVENELGGVTPEDAMMHILAQAPGLMQRGRVALRNHEPLNLLAVEARQLYAKMETILQKVLDRFNHFQELFAPRTAIINQVHAHYQRIYGLALSICLAFLCIVKALDPNDADLDNDSIRLSKDVLTLTDEAAMYRPLGASYTILCLSAAWCSTKNERIRSILRSKLAEQRLDYPGTSAETVEVELNRVFRQLSLLEP